jgi:hypothetical protein
MPNAYCLIPDLLQGWSQLMLSHFRILSFLSLLIFMGSFLFAAETTHAKGASSRPSSLHLPGDVNPLKDPLPTSLLSSKKVPSATAGKDSETSDSQKVTYDPRLLLPPGKTEEQGKLINNVNALILEGVEELLQDRKSQLLTVLGLECVDVATCELIKKNEDDIRQAIRKTIGRYSVQKVSTLEGKMELRDELTRVTNQAIGTTGVKEVYFQTLTLLVSRK